MAGRRRVVHRHDRACSSSARSPAGSAQRTRTAARTRRRRSPRRRTRSSTRAAPGRRPRTCLLVVTHPELKVTDPAFQSFVARHHRDAQGPDRRRERPDGPGVRRHPRPGDGPAPGRARRPGPVGGPDRRDDHGRPGHRRPAPRAGPSGDRGDRGRRSRQGLRRPHPEPDADQRGHHDPHQQQPGHDVRHDRPHVHHPADHVRGVRRRDRAARARDHRAAGGVRHPRAVQPGGGTRSARMPPSSSS